MFCLDESDIVLSETNGFYSPILTMELLLLRTPSSSSMAVRRP